MNSSHDGYPNKSEIIILKREQQLAGMRLQYLVYGDLFSVYFLTR